MKNIHLYVLLQENLSSYYGTQNIRSFTLKKEYASGTVEINTNDARDLKLRSGWKIKVVTRRGEIIRTVNVTHAVKPGTINVSIHNIDGLTQSLVRSDLEKDAKTPIMKICAANWRIFNDNWSKNNLSKDQLSQLLSKIHKDKKLIGPVRMRTVM